MQQVASAGFLAEAVESPARELEDFDALVSKYWPKVFRFALASLRDPDAAGDVAQDCLWKAHLHAAGFRGASSVNTWLMQIAVNLVRDRARNRRLRFWKQTRETAVDWRELGGQLPEAAKYLKAFDIAVMPSVKEGFPYFALEAMAAELPLIASQVGGLPEIIEDQKTGYLVPAKSILALAEKLKLLVDTPELRVNLGQAGRQRLLNEFSQEQMINKTFALYQN